MVGEWDQRMLCPNGACIGVIGPDGTCKVCGHVAPNWGDERRRGLTPLPPESPTQSDDEEEGDEGEGDDEGDELPDEDEDEDEGGEEPDAASISADPDWQARTLCADGACVGVIGKTGTCSTCGKRPTG